VLELMADADSVERKLTVSESQHFSAAASLGIDPLDAEIRQVYSFDTPDLNLNQRGVVLRARRVQRKGAIPS
jgi:inorganic triphosphatase YgiF